MARRRSRKLWRKEWITHPSGTLGFSHLFSAALESLASLLYDGYYVMKAMDGDVKANAYKAIKGLYIGLDDNPEWKDNKKEAIIQVLDCMEDISKTATKIYIEAARQVLAEMEPPLKKKVFFGSLFS